MEDIRQGVATGQVKMVGVEMWITDRGKCLKKSETVLAGPGVGRCQTLKTCCPERHPNLNLTAMERKHGV